MPQKTVKLTGSNAFQDIGTVGQTVPGLSGNMQSVNQILDVGLRNTGNITDSFVRVSDVTAIGLATLNGNVLTAADLSGIAGSITVNGTTGIVGLTFVGATVSVSGNVATITVTGGGGGSGTVTAVSLASTTLTVSGTVTTSGALHVDLTSPQVADLALAATSLQPVTGLSGSYTNTNLTINSAGQITAAANGSGGGGGGGTPVPETISDLLVWYASDDVGLDPGCNVVRLRDRAPNATGNCFLPLSTNTAAAKVSAALLNGLPTIDLLASFTFPTPLFPTQNGTTGQTYFLVYKQDSYGGSNYLVTVGGAAGQSNGVALYSSYQGGGGGKLNLSKSGVGPIATATTPVPASVWTQANAKYNSATGDYSFRMSQADNGTGTSSATGAGTGGLGYIGVDQGSYYPPSGHLSIAELMIYDRELTLTEVQTIETYLHNKWGV